jgi:hypothetical protein
MKVRLSRCAAASNESRLTELSPPTRLLFPLGEEYLRLSHLQQCGEIVEQMLESAHASGHRQDEADVYRLKGELLLARGESHAGEAENCFRTAIEIARAQSAKWFELCAATRLAQLLRDTNRCEEARTMLVEIYGWFGEAFDTADLKAAKALLDELESSQT